MAACVAPHRRQCDARASGHDREQQARQTRRDQVRDVIDTRRRPAESVVPWGAMADHGVQRVDRLVGCDAGQAENRAPEQRRHNSVGRVFGEVLRRSRQSRPHRAATGRVRRSSRPPGAPQADRLPSAVVPASTWSCIERAATSGQAGARGEDQAWPSHRQYRCADPTDAGGRRDDGYRNAQSSAAPRSGRVGFAVEAPIHRGNHRADPRHGMSDPGVDRLRASRGSHQKPVRAA